MAIKWKNIAIDFVIVAILANMAVLAKCHQNQQTEVFQLHVYFPERFSTRKVFYFGIKLLDMHICKLVEENSNFE